MKTITFIIILLFVSQGICLMGQETSPGFWLNSDTDDFKTIQQKANNYFDENKQGKGTGFKQWKRWEYLNEARLTADGKICNHTLYNWEAYQDYLDKNPQYKNPDPTDATNGSWTFLAPTSYVSGNGWLPGIGRINCIAFHPTDPNIFYVGAPAGGLWKTTDDGASWTSLSNGIPSIGVSGIVVDRINPNILYILTGDGDGGNTHSIGVLKSYDDGASWWETDLSFDKTSTVRGYKLRAHPTDNDVLFAVTSQGIFKTIDAGNSWTNRRPGSFKDIEFKPGNPMIMYATAGTYFFKSIDGGYNWSGSTATGVPVNANRMEIGVTPSNPEYVYLVCGPSLADSTFVGVYWSYDSGNNFYLQGNSPNMLGGHINGNNAGDQALYDLAIAVSRTSSAQLMIGGVNTWKSDNYGYNWNITSYWVYTNNTIGYTHADIHALEINPLNNHLYCGSDGGIFKSTDFGDNWTDLTFGTSNMQFYRIAGYEPNANLIIGGSQDNGTNKWTGSSSVLHVLGADGMDCMINHQNPDIMYFCSQNGGLEKTIDGGNSTWPIRPDSLAIGSWVTPLAMDPDFPELIYAGYDDVYKSIDGGANWTNKGADGRGALAIGTSNPSRLYASFEATINVTSNEGFTWHNRSAGLPGNHISFIAVNPYDADDVFVTLKGFTAGEKVYFSDNAGQTWTNISGNLPNIIVNCIAYEKTNGNPEDALYIGTDVGVFYRDNDLGDWIPFSNMLPTVPVYDLEMNESQNLIFAGTFGRGLWRSSTYLNCASTLNLYNTAPAGYSLYQASSILKSTMIYNEGFGQEGYYGAGNSIKLLPGFHVFNGSKFKAVLGPCGSGIPDEINQNDSVPGD